MLDRQCEKEGSALQKIWHCYSQIASFCMHKEVCRVIKWPEDLSMWEDQYLLLRIAMEHEIREIPGRLCYVHEHAGRSVNELTSQSISERIHQHEVAVRRFFAEYGDRIGNEIQWKDAVHLLMSKYRTAATDALIAGDRRLARAMMLRSMKYLRPENAIGFGFTLGRVLTGLKPV